MYSHILIFGLFLFSICFDKYIKFEFACANSAYFNMKSLIPYSNVVEKYLHNRRWPNTMQKHLILSDNDMSLYHATIMFGRFKILLTKAKFN